jgi:TonB family protein
MRAIESQAFDTTMTAAQAGLDWKRMSPRDEEFSIFTPVQPSVLFYEAGSIFTQGGERVLEHRAYSGYAEGFVFVLESYKAARPGRLIGEMNRMFGGQHPLEEVKVDGFTGKKYQMIRSNLPGYVYDFVTNKHVYILTMAARDANNPVMAQFLSSFKLGDNSIAGDIVAKREDSSATSPVDEGEVFTPREVTRKATVVWKPEPEYTESARRNQRTGTVVLKVIFTASGHVVLSEVTLGLRDGLTEKAIEAAKNIRFLPAEKDGRAVSVRMQIEYNFNLY